MKRLSVSDIMATTANIQSNDTHEINTDAYDETQADTSLDLSSLIDDVLASKSRIAPDLRVDDRDLKEFPNFYSWCFSKEGGNQAPFAKQLAFATHLLGEYCSRCSVKSFRNIAKVPVDFDAKDFPEKVTFLEYGVCPKCGARKSELVRTGELNFYQELALCAGQRCITGDSLILTSKGYQRIKSLVPDADYGYTDNQEIIHNGQILTHTSKFFRAKAEPLYKVTLRSGLTITGTKDHPIKTKNGFIKIPDLLGEYVETPVGTNVYGSNVLTEDQLREYLDYDYIPDCILTADYATQMKFLQMIGIEIGKIVRIRNRKMLKEVAMLLRNMGYATIIRSSTIQVSETNYTRVQTLYDRCVYVESVAEEETFDVTVPNGSTFVSNGILNHNSGKSAFFNLFVPYVLHKWVKVNKPVETLGLMKDAILIGSLGALTFQKANELLWQPISNAIADSKWWQQYFEILDYYGERSGTELYKFKDTFLALNHKQIIVAPVGPSKRKLRGATRILGVLDEIGWFPHGEDNEQKEMANANEVYISLDRSLKTVRNATARLLEQGMDNIPNGYMAGISSPSSYNDKIMTLVRTHEGSREVLTGHFPTWEMNPMFKKEDFAKEYRDDPVKAERDFGANPPMAENPWISNVSQLNDLFDGRFNIKYQYNYLVNKSGKETVYAKVLGAHKPSSVPATVMAIDAGYSNNSFALSIVTPELGLGSRIKGARVLALLEVAPKKGQNVINFAKLFDEVVKPLVDQFNVKLVATDRWQSILLLQKLEEETGVATDTYSLRPADFEYIRDYLLDDDQTLHFPKPEIDIGKIFTFSMDEYPHCFRYMPNAHLYHQFSTVNLDGRGNVDKGNGFTDDLLRATCLGISYCLNQEDVIKYKLDGAKVNEVRAIGTRQASSLTSGGTISAKATGGSFTGTSLGSRG